MLGKPSQAMPHNDRDSDMTVSQKSVIFKTQRVKSWFTSLIEMKARNAQYAMAGCSARHQHTQSNHYRPVPYGQHLRQYVRGKLPQPTANPSPRLEKSAVAALLQIAPKTSKVAWTNDRLECDL